MKKKGSITVLCALLLGALVFFFSCEQPGEPGPDWTGTISISGTGLLDTFNGHNIAIWVFTDEDDQKTVGMAVAPVTNNAARATAGEITETGAGTVTVGATPKYFGIGTYWLYGYGDLDDNRKSDGDPEFLDVVTVIMGEDAVLDISAVDFQ